MHFLNAGSINHALTNMLRSSASKEDIRPPSPFPTIPDISSSSEPLPDKTTSVIRSVTPSFLEPKIDPKEIAAEIEQQKMAIRAASPFPSIPNVALDEVNDDDIQKFKENKTLESVVRPSSPFPSIPDITLNPLVTIRTSPVPFKLESTVTFDNKVEETVEEFKLEEEPVVETETSNIIQEVEPVAFPTIPNIAKYLAKPDINLLKPVPSKPYESISLDTRKYDLKDDKPNLVPKIPEFSFALADPGHKVVENVFSEGTSNCIRSVQSELFECQGHFNASRSCSPRVFVPISKETSPAKIDNTPTPTLTKVIIDTIEETRNPICEQHIKNLTLANKEKSGTIISQKTCFNELEGIQDAYKLADQQSYSRKCLRPMEESHKVAEDNEIDCILKQMKKVREGIDIDDANLSLQGQPPDLIQHNGQIEDQIQEVTVEDNSGANIQINTQQLENDNSHILENMIVLNTQSENIVTTDSEQIKTECSETETTKIESAPLSELPDPKYIEPISMELENNKEVNINSSVQTSNPESGNSADIQPKEEVKLDHSLNNKEININGLVQTLNPKLDNLTDIQSKEEVKQNDSLKSAENSTAPIKTKPQRKLEPLPDNEPVKYKKPPETVSGARPLFGQLDINAEFKKALVGRQKSIKAKRSRDVSKNIENGHEPKVKVEKTEIVSNEETSDNSKLFTDYSNIEKAQIEITRPNANEEIEKIYYQQNRQYEIDYQTVQEQIIAPETNSYHPQYGQNFNYNITQQVTNEEEEYKKVPVKNLIKSFEQSSIPAFKYKQIRDPLPDVVEKLSNGKQEKLSEICSNSQTQNGSQEQILRKAEEDFNNLYYVANSQVKTNYFTPDQSKVSTFHQSENSSFCRYSSQSSFQQNSSMQSSQDACSVQLTGKLLRLCA